MQLTPPYTISYSAPLYVDIEKHVQIPSDDIDPETGDLKWVNEQDQDDEAEFRHFIGYVRSIACLL